MKEDEEKLSNDNDDATSSETLSDLEEMQSDKLLETNEDENDAVSSPDTVPQETNDENIADDGGTRSNRGAGDPM